MLKAGNRKINVYGVNKQTGKREYLYSTFRHMSCEDAVADTLRMGAARVSTGIRTVMLDDYKDFTAKYAR